MTEAQREDGRRLASELRFGLGFGDPNLEVAAQRLWHALLDTGPVPLRPPDSTITAQRFSEQLRDFLEEQLEAGRLIVQEEPAIANVPEQELAVRRPRLDAQPPEQLVPRREAPLETSFEVRFVDEIGQAISGLQVKIAAGERVERVTTNAAGVALLEGTTAGSGTVTVLDPDALDKIVEPRWAKPRAGTAPRGFNTTEQLFDGGEIDVTDIKAGVPNTIVIKPGLGLIFMELLDKSGRVHHAGRDYVIAGPTTLSGTTDEAGRLRHEDVHPGDYTLTLSLADDSYESPVDVLDPAEADPQVRFMGAVPRVVFARLKGMFFETNKSFLLPVVVDHFKNVRELYGENNPSDLLIVGHTDTTAQPAINDPLSLERADCTAAYLIDDVDAWLKMYGTGTPQSRRWGNHEDLLMIEAMPDFGTKPPSEDTVRWYQRTRELTVDGDAGTETRTQLVTEYMALDGTPLKDDPNFEISITTHGCGENFPLDDGGDELDSAPVDEKEDAPDRRVELFFFDAEFGIQPPPPGKNSAQGSTAYPEWRKKAVLVHELESDHVEGLLLEWSDDLDEGLPDDLLLTATQNGLAQSIDWADGDVSDDYRRFVFTQIGGNDPVTLTAASDELALSLTLWDEQVLNDPDNPPTWTHWLEEMVSPSDTDGTLEAAGEVPAVSDAQSRPDDLSGDMFA